MGLGEAKGAYSRAMPYDRRDEQTNRSIRAAGHDTGERLMERLFSLSVLETQQAVPEAAWCLVSTSLRVYELLSCRRRVVVSRQRLFQLNSTFSWPNQRWYGG